MANGVCAVDTIATEAKCFQNPCINEQDRMAIGVLLKAQALVTAGGTDYTSDFDALIQDSVGLLNITIGHWTLSAEELVLLFAADLPDPAPVGDLLESVACLRCQPLKVLRAAFMFLNCAITAEG